MKSFLGLLAIIAEMQPITPANPDRNQSVDTFRLLAALSVVILHLEYPNLPGDLVVGIRLLSRWAIPFFFIISGYYFASKSVDMKHLNVQTVAERLIWIFLLWSLIYAPVVIDQHDVTTLLRRILSATFLYYGDFVHLWFITSLLYAYLFVAFCYNFRLPGVLPFISALIVILALVSTPYSAAVNLGFAFEFDFTYWISIPFLFIGFYFFTRRYPSWWISLILIVSGVLLQIFEARFLYQQYAKSAYEHEFLIGTIPFAIGMAGLALNNLKWLQFPILSHWGRDYSLGIYLVHLLIIHLFAKFVSGLMPGLTSNPIWQAVLPLLILILCLLVLGVIRRFLPTFFNILYGRHIST